VVAAPGAAPEAADVIAQGLRRGADRRAAGSRSAKSCVIARIGYRKPEAHSSTVLGRRAGIPRAPRVTMSFQKILCAIDFSDSSRQALRAAAELARTSPAKLLLVHVWQAPLWTTDYGIQLPSDALLEAREVEEANLASWQAEAQRLGAAEVTSELVRGVPWDEIVGVARDDKAVDLIVLGTHGHTGRRALIGSVAERVVRHAPCTIMVVGSRERDLVPG
jgi:universal stress protein A